LIKTSSLKRPATTLALGLEARVWESREAMREKQAKRNASEPWMIKVRRGVTVVGD
jgi:hypothetical protein